MYSCMLEMGQSRAVASDPSDEVGRTRSIPPTPTERNHPVGGAHAPALQGKVEPSNGNTARSEAASVASLIAASPRASIVTPEKDIENRSHDSGETCDKGMQTCMDRKLPAARRLAFAGEEPQQSHPPQQEDSIVSSTETDVRSDENDSNHTSIKKVDMSHTGYYNNNENADVQEQQDSIQSSPVTVTEPAHSQTRERESILLRPTNARKAIDSPQSESDLSHLRVRKEDLRYNIDDNKNTEEQQEQEHGLLSIPTVSKSNCSHHDKGDSKEIRLKKEDSSDPNNHNHREPRSAVRATTVSSEEERNESRPQKRARPSWHAESPSSSKKAKSTRIPQFKSAELTIDQRKYLEEVKKNAVTKEKKFPGKRTAVWCLLKVLHSSPDQEWSKEELKHDAEQYYGAPMEGSPPLLDSQAFGAWSAMKNLEKKCLVERKKGGPNGDLFWLTEEGQAFSQRLLKFDIIEAAGIRQTQTSIGAFFAKKR